MGAPAGSLAICFSLHPEKPVQVEVYIFLLSVTIMEQENQHRLLLSHKLPRLLVLTRFASTQNDPTQYG